MDTWMEWMDLVFVVDLGTMWLAKDPTPSYSRLTEAFVGSVGLPASLLADLSMWRVKVADDPSLQNAVFDLVWSEDDSEIATASGDQTIRIVDSTYMDTKCAATLQQRMVNQ